MSWLLLAVLVLFIHSFSRASLLSAFPSVVPMRWISISVMFYPLITWLHQYTQRCTSSGCQLKHDGTGDSCGHDVIILFSYYISSGLTLHRAMAKFFLHAIPMSLLSLCFLCLHFSYILEQLPLIQKIQCLLFYTQI